MAHILVASHEFPPGVGGASRFAELVSTLLSTQGVRVTVLTPVAAGSSERASAYARRRITIPMRSGFSHWAWRTHILRAWRAEQPTMILATDVMTQRACALLPSAIRRRCALIAHGTEILANFSEPWPKRMVYTRLYRDAGVILANSRYTQALLLERGVDPERVRLAFPWLESAWWEEPARPERIQQRYGLAGRRVLLTVGRLSIRKAQDAVIRVLPLIRARVPNVVYLLVGAGEQRPALEALARAGGVDEAVVFAGEVPRSDRLMDYYDACDVFVMPSRVAGPLVEGLGIAFLEAQARGKPVVGGRTGGAREALQDGVTGRLADPERVPELAEMLANMLMDRDDAARMGRAGREWVRETFGASQSARWAQALLGSGFAPQRHVPGVAEQAVSV